LFDFLQAILRCQFKVSRETKGERKGQSALIVNIIKLHTVVYR
jgi:hypothetical protein